MTTVTPDRQHIKLSFIEEDNSVEDSHNEDRNRMPSWRSNSQSVKIDAKNSVSQSKDQSLGLNSNRNYRENSTLRSRNLPESSRDRTRQNSSRTKNEDSFSEYNNYVLSSSKRLPTAESEQERMQEYYGSKLLTERKSIEENLRSFWEKRIEKISRSYQERIEELETLLAASRNEREDRASSKTSAETEKQMRDSYERKYLEKLAAMRENARIHEEERIMRVVEDVKLELEAQYEKKLCEREEQVRQEALKQLELFMREIESKNNPKRSTSSEALQVEAHRSDSHRGIDISALKKDLEINLRKEIEEEYKVRFEKEKAALVGRFSENRAVISQRNSVAFENQLRESITREIREQANRIMHRKEKELQVTFRQKLENHKRELDEIYETELNAKLNSDRVEIEAEKNKIARLRSLENIKLKKSEENQKMLQQKFKYLQESYNKKIQELQTHTDEVVTEGDRQNENKNPNFHKFESRLSTSTKPENRNSLQSEKKTSRGLTHRGTENSSQRGRSTAKKSQTSAVSRNTPSIFDNTERKGEVNTAWRSRFSEYVQQNSSSKSLPPQKLEVNNTGFKDKDALIELIDPLSPPVLHSQKEPHKSTPAEEQEVYEKESKRSPLPKDITRSESYNRLQPLKKGESAKVVEELLEKYANNPADSKIDLNKLVSQRLANREQSTTPLQSKTANNLSSSEGINRNSQSKTTSHIPYKAQIGLINLQHKSLSEASPIMNDENDITKTKNYNQSNNFSFSRGSAKTTESKSRNSHSNRSTTKNKENSGSQKSRDGSLDNTPRTTTKREAPPSAYEETFELKQNDKNNTRKMKRMKQEIEYVLRKDDLLEETYFMRESHFITNFIPTLGILSNENLHRLITSMQTLFLLWKNCGIAFSDRLSSLEALELLNNEQKILSKVLLEIEHLQILEKDTRELIDLVNKGYQIKNLISADDYSYKACRNLFSELQKISLKLKDALDQYVFKFKKDALYRGILIYDISRYFLWEVEYAQFEDMRRDVIKKIKRRI